jgi:hypothetical protein
MKFLPVDDESDPELAEVLQGLARQVEYESRADFAYITALDQATRGGLGFFRLILKPDKTSPVQGKQDAKIVRDDLIRQITEAGFSRLIEVQSQTGAQLLAIVTEASNRAIHAEGAAAALIAANQTASAAAAIANDNAPWEQYINGIPMFAAGGMHRGGLRIVGENGPELQATGPSRIWNGQQIGSAMNGDTARAIAALSEEVKALRVEMRATGQSTAFATNQMARDLRGTIKAGVLVVQTDSDNPLATEAA